MRATLLLLSLSSLAMAGWHELGTVTGAPTDVVVVDAGVVVVTSSGVNGEALVLRWPGDGGVETLAQLTDSSGYVGAAYDGCLSALTPGGVLHFSSGCGDPVSVGVGSHHAYRAIGARGVATVGSVAATQLLAAPDITGVWQPLVPSFAQPSSARGISFTAIGGTTWAATTTSIAPGVRLSIDGGAPGGVSSTPASLDVVVFEYQGGAALLLVSASNELMLVGDVTAPATELLSVPAGETLRRVSQVLMSTADGVVFSPIPQPAQPYAAWVQRSTAPPLDGRVHCLNAKWCAGVTSAGVVWLYENASAPQVSVNAPAYTPGQAATFTADAGDDDGDPLFFEWLAPGAQINANNSSATITFPPNSCTANVELRVYDGVHQSAVSTAFSSDVRGEVQLTGAVTAIAGGPAVTLTAALDGGCADAAFTWASSDGQSGGGDFFVYTPPATSCTPGATVTVTATATWSSGAPATSDVLHEISLEAWGAPLTPEFTSPATQPPGTQVLWAPENPDHVCAAAPGFPGTVLLWTVDGGDYATVADGGLLIDSTNVCVPTRVEASAQRVVEGDVYDRRSDAGVLIVDLEAATEPLSAATPFFLVADAGQGVAAGTTSVNASCLEQRTLSAEVFINGTDGELSRGTFATPGAWSLSIPGGCAGGEYEVVAQLYEDGGFTGAEARQLISTELTPVAAGELDVEEIQARCGRGAWATAELLPVEGSCLSADVTWRALAGPPLDVREGTGSTVIIQSTSRTLSVVGQELALEFTLDAGNGNAVTVTRSLPITVEPFVQLEARTAPALPRYESGVEHIYTLTSHASCDVWGLSAFVPLPKAVLESVRVDGEPVEAFAVEGGFEVRNLSLGSAPVELRVHSAPVLLSSDRSPALDVRLNGVPVTLPYGDDAPPPGCGCTGGNGLLAALALLLLGRRRRRA